MTKINVKTVGLIGFGAFSNLLEKLLTQYDPALIIKYASRSRPIDNQKIFSFEEVAASDLVIPSVPIRAFEKTIISLKEHVKPNAIILDVCSVKVHPKSVLLKHLAKDFNLIVAHPNFGPESYRLNNNSSENLNFIIERLNCNDESYTWVMDWLKHIRVNILEMSAEEHDKKIGVPHFISMYVGILLNKLSIERTEYGAASTQKMFDMAEGVGKDFGILEDMVTFNPYVQEELNKLSKSSTELLNSLNINN